MINYIDIIDDYLKYGEIASKDLFDALTAAKKALEREIPEYEIKQPDETYICPVCGGRIVFADQEYCDECGQAVSRPIE